MPFDARRLPRAAASGLLATAVDVGTLTVLVELARVHVTVAALLGAAAGATVGFLAGKRWAFCDESPIRPTQVVAFAAVAVGSALLVAGAVHLFAVVLGWTYLLAKALGAVLVFACWSYPAQARLVFAPRLAPARSPRWRSSWTSAS